MTLQSLTLKYTKIVRTSSGRNYDNASQFLKKVIKFLTGLSKKGKIYKIVVRKLDLSIFRGPVSADMNL